MSEKPRSGTGERSANTALVEVDTGKLSSATLARLIEEVRNEQSSAMHPYDRVHNRHNRGG